MIKSVKIRLKPTKVQEELMVKSCGIARFVYNWGLSKWKANYESGLKPSKLNIRTEFNNTIKKDETYKWLYEVSGKVGAQAFDDLEMAFKQFFTGMSQYPKFKSKRKSKPSFYVRYDALKFKDGKVNLEKIGKVTYKTNYQIPHLDKYVNPRCSYDGKYWYLTFGYEQNENQVALNQNLSIGIDLGIKQLAYLSTHESIKNINKTKTVSKLKKKLKQKQRQVSRKYRMNKQGNQFVKTKNIIKLEREIKLINRRLTNIRQNHLHQATNLIIKKRPYRVVAENLNVVGMMKNKHLSKAIGEVGFFEFKRQLAYKARFNGIEFIEADRFYPSSKTCSCCGQIKQDLKLKDRSYQCGHCGLEIDRDLNAAVNLSRYELVSGD
ncbi:MAG: RNA-guided endonuclease InsQ/TnpB family protein [Turicibacter sp.]